MTLPSSDVPVGWAVSQAVAHASSVHASRHTKSALPSGSRTTASDSAQQFASRQLSHVPSPDDRPQLGALGGGVGGGGEDPPVHAAQLFSTHDERLVSSAVPAGCAVSQAVSHVESLQESRQSMRFVQSASFRHEVTSLQHVVVRHASQVGSPLVTPPHAPPVVGGGDELPPSHSVAQPLSTHDMKSWRMMVPGRCALSHAPKHVSSVHAS